MEIEKVKINDLLEYKYNAKEHPEWQIEQIANSIKEFGFNDPIAIDENNTIIEGHGRLYALQELGYDEVDCIRLSHLTEEQKKAYVLAHNKLTMNTDFDIDLLNIELDNIVNIDMSEFGFIETNEGLKEDDSEESPDEFHKETTLNQYNLNDYDAGRTEGFYNMPTIKGVDYVPKDLQGFNFVLSNCDNEKGVHFFIDDYQFQRVWERPYFYIEKMAEVDCVFTPDFSLYTDMPISMQIWNVYRSRLIGQIMQDYGLIVIPTVSWTFEDSFKFCFDGLPKNATLAISVVGVKNDTEKLEIWTKGVDEMIKRLTPKNLLIYGEQVDYDFKNINVVYFKNKNIERVRKWEEEGKVDKAEQRVRLQQSEMDISHNTEKSNRLTDC